MTVSLGTVKPGTTLQIPFDSFDGGDGSSSATSGLAVGDIKIYKDGSATERASTSGYAVTASFDSITGINEIEIDLADNTTGQFFACGSRYNVVVDSVTIDSQTVSFTAATFRIGYPGALWDTTVGGYTSQTEFVLTAGSARNDAYNGCLCYIHDEASDVDVQIGYVLDYVGASKTVTLAADPGVFTFDQYDNVSLMPPSNITGHTPQTGDSYAIVNSGVHGNAALKTLIDAVDDFVDTEIASILAAVDTEVAAILVDTGTTLPAQISGLNDPTSAAIADAVLDEALSGHTTAGTLGKAVADIEADTNELQTDDIPGTLAAMDTKLDTIDDFLDTEMAAVLAAVDTEVAAILVDTGTTIPAQITALLTTAGTEAYRGTGATGSVFELLYEILANVVEFAIASTTKTAKKLDGTTAAKTYTLNDATNPTSITETT